MTTIDLSRDLEAWYELDSNYFDSQRNVIQDQSGYGRHPTASGGPTIGVEGPNDFEAASGDGTDNQFLAPSSVTGDTFTLFIIVKFEADGTNNEWVGSYDGFGINYDESDDSIGWRDGIDGTSKRFGDSNVGGWNRFTVTSEYDSGVDETTFRGYSRENLDFNYTNSGSGKPDDDIRLMSQWTDDKYLNGRLALFGYWSRILSDAEIGHLNRLTAPRRSQL